MTYEQGTVCTLYKKFLTFYPREFRERFSESMLQTFNDLYQERQTEGRWFGFIPWLFVETTTGIAKEHVLLMNDRRSHDE